MMFEVIFYLCHCTRPALNIPAIIFILTGPKKIMIAISISTLKNKTKKLPHLPSRAISLSNSSIQHPQHIPANSLQFVTRFRGKSRKLRRPRIRINHGVQLWKIVYGWIWKSFIPPKFYFWSLIYRSQDAKQAKYTVWKNRCLSVRFRKSPPN